MSIDVLWPWELGDLTGKTAIVIDLWAATSNIALLLGKGAKSLTVVNKENVVEAKEVYGNAIVVGEHYQLPVDFFNYSNYPSDVNKVPAMKQILYMTTNGSYFIELAISKKAKPVITGSILNFEAINQYLHNSKPENVVIVPSGNRVKKDGKAREDMLCAEAFANAFRGKEINWNEQISKLKRVILRDYGLEKNFNPLTDFDAIFQLNKYNVVPICFKEKWIEIKDFNKL